jgi:restriction system protein
MSKKQGAQFVRYFAPLLDALRALGGSATPAEATDKVAELCGVSEQEQNELMQSGSPRFKNQVAWARFYLKREGLVGSSKRGVWNLTERGTKTQLTYPMAREIFLRQVRMDAEARKQKGVETPEAEVDAPDQIEISSSENYRSALLAIIQSIPFAGFERLCQRLLREAGFQQVVVTGKSGDNGIDGHGILEVNPFLTFKVLFQCKRYRGTVGAPFIRDFRGAMLGRADKGIILTTGTFTMDAKREARRDGAPPVELVDGDKLLDMFEKLELGLVPRIVYDIDESFFDDFR